jgi:hypothetical protein
MNNQPAPSSVEQTPSLVRVASDELLLLGSRLHDDVALGVLFDRHGREVYALALETLHHTDAAEAVMQDVFLRCWRGVELYDASRGTTHEWLLAITRSRALDALAKLEPFGGAPDLSLRLDDAELLRAAEPASGARERLLSRARAEGGGARTSDAPAVVIPAAELGADTDVDSEAPTLTDMPIGPATATHAAQPEVAEAQTETADIAPSEEIASVDQVDDVSVADAAHATDVHPEPPTAKAAIIPAAPVETPTDEAVTLDVARADAPTDEAVTIEAEQPEPPTVEAVVVDVEQAEATAVADGEATDVEEDAAEESASDARQPAEIPPGEALAAALAPIQPRRQQQPKRPPEPPTGRRFKLASILWAVALLVVVGSGLVVAAWSATGPHLSPDLAILSRLPGGRVVTLRGAGAPNATARVYSIDSGRRAELAADGLPPLPNARVYQLWILEPNQQARSAGAFYVNRKGDAVVPLSLGGPIERLQVLFLTQEQAPGVTTPSGQRLLEGTP